MKLAHIEGVHACPKGLRHSFAIHCLEKGIPLNLGVISNKSQKCTIAKCSRCSIMALRQTLDLNHNIIALLHNPIYQNIST